MNCYQLNLALTQKRASTFNLEKAVCNHGLFMMAPNIWIPETKTLQRPLRLTHTNRSVMVRISHPSPADTANSLRILMYSEQVPSPIDQKSILDQVSRMLRISERDEMNAREFYKVHPQAEERGFSRIFRSLTLFEDAIKSILLCGCGWKNTLDMAEALCMLQPELRNRLLKVDTLKRKRSEEISIYKNFPSPEELASTDTKFLNKKCNLGYRAGLIVEFAKRVVSNTVEFDKFEEAESFDDIYQDLLKIKGFGPFVSANIRMCIGSYTGAALP